MHRNYQDAFDGDCLHDCILQLDDGFNNYHKYCHDLDNSCDIIAKRLIIMAAIILLED